MGKMRGSIRASVLVLALMVTAGAVGAWPIHQWRWQCHGPYLGIRTRLALPPAPHDGVFAVQYGGGFFTGRAGSDDQTIWEPGSRNGLSSLNMTAVTAGYGLMGVTVLVGTDTGLYRSDDWGDTWVNVDDLGHKRILCLATQPSAVGAADYFYAGCFDGSVFVSSDGGVTWTDRTGSLPMNPVISLATDPVTAMVAYAGHEDGSVHRTVDGGVVWTEIFPSDGTGQAAAIAVHPAIPSRLYVGFIPIGDGRNGVYRSSNSGGSWIRTALDAPVRCLAIDPEDPDHLFAGSEDTADGTVVYRTTNNGLTWLPFDSGLLAADTQISIESLAFVPSNREPAGLFAGTFDGAVCYSTDGGSSWSWQHQGLTVDGVRAVASEPVAPYRVWALTAADGLFQSEDHGWTWWRHGEAWDPPTTGESCASLAVAPDGPAGELVLHAVWDRRYFRSDDGGHTWTERWLMDRAYCLATDPDDPATVYAGGDRFLGSQNGVYKSTDWGQTWTTLPLAHNLAWCLAVNPLHPQILYEGGNGWSGTARLNRSADGGATWTPADTGIGDRVVRSLAVHPANPTRLFAGMQSDGLFRSSDSGGNWTATAPDLAAITVRTLAIDPDWTSTLMIGSPNGVFRSSDGGNSTINVGYGIPTSSITQLAYHTNGTGLLFAVTPSTGVFFRRFLCDLNLDDVLDHLDLQEMNLFLPENQLRLVAGEGAADVNQDGKVNVVDLLQMKLALR